MCCRKAVSWNPNVDDIEDKGKPIGFPDIEKYQIQNDYTKLNVVIYDTMLLLQSCDKDIYQLIEYGETGFFIKNGNVILEFIYTERGICNKPRVIPPIIIDEKMVEVTFITWGFERNYFAVLSNEKVVEINARGEIQKEFPICTGISVVGCDFRGCVMDSGIREKILFHGGRVN